MATKKKPQGKKYTCVFQDGFRKTFEAESENAAAAMGKRWAESPASGRNGKTIILITYQQ